MKTAWIFSLIGLVLLAVTAGGFYFSRTEFHNQSEPTGTPVAASDFARPQASFKPGHSGYLLYNLSITNTQPVISGNQEFIDGTLQNSSNYDAKNIAVQVNFYKDAAKTQLVDSKTVTIDGVTGNAATAFHLPVSTPVATYFISANITTADY